MLVDFFLQLKKAGVPVTLKEFLSLLEALQKQVIFGSVEEFYYLGRLCLVKDESHFDKYDRAFMTFFAGIADADPLEGIKKVIPEEWLKKMTERFLTEEEKAALQGMGGLDKLMETLKQRLAEQKERHQGGSKWIGTGGTSPFGAYGYNPEGVRIGQEHGRNQRAVKVWDKREFKDLDDKVQLGTRNMKVALRKLRKFARDGALEELDLPGTLRATADNAGYLDIQMVRERHNRVKVLLLLDIGGTMDRHVKLCQQLFSAARSEFKHLESYYFHNFIYERLWKENYRRWNQHHPTADVLHQLGPDYKLIIVGDATMGPYEIHWVGGSIEHHNPEPGSVWLRRFTDQFRKAVWINPVPEQEWRYTESIQMVSDLMEQRMYPLTLEGLERAVKYLVK